MKYYINNKTLVLSEKPKKVYGGLKINFSRCGDERYYYDYPVAITDVDGVEYDISALIDCVSILRVEILQPRFLWWFKQWRRVDRLI